MSYRTLPTTDQALLRMLQETLDRVYRLENGGAIAGNVSFGSTIRIGDLQITAPTGDTPTSRLFKITDLIDGTAVTLPILAGAGPPAGTPPTSNLLYLDTAGLLVYYSAGGAWLPLTTGVGTTLDYVEFTAPVTISAGSEGTANTIVTSDAVTFDGATTVMIDFVSSGLLAGGSATGLSAHIVLFEDGVSLGDMFIGQLGASEVSAGVGSRRFAPSAGSHTYSIRGWRQTNNFTVQAGPGGAGAILPGFIRIVRA